MHTHGPDILNIAENSRLRNFAVAFRLRNASKRCNHYSKNCHGLLAGCYSIRYGHIGKHYEAKISFTQGRNATRTLKFPRYLNSARQIPSPSETLQISQIHPPTFATNKIYRITEQIHTRVTSPSRFYVAQILHKPSNLQDTIWRINTDSSENFLVFLIAYR